MTLDPVRVYRLNSLLFSSEIYSFFYFYYIELIGVMVINHADIYR